MAHRQPTQTPQGTLQRGKACLSCRRRKMRCDGERPYCTQCISGNRAEDCEYTDVQGRTRTQMLEETVALLQARVRELENPNIASQSVYLHDPYTASRSRGTGPIGSVSGEQTSSPSVTTWWEMDEPLPEMTNFLLEIFLRHAKLLGFALSPERFRSDLNLPRPHPDRPHAALLHAVLLWALRLSKSHDFTQHENLYLQRSILALQDALSFNIGLEPWVTARRRIHAIQAEILLAQYFFSLGRLLEGRYHSSAAVSLSVSCGLHRIRPFASTSLRGGQEGSNFNMLEPAPARNGLEHGERIRIFWAVYILDRCWSAALGVPCALTDDTALGTQIDTEWPQLVDYERMQDTSSSSVPNNQTLQRFLSGEPPIVREEPLSPTTLHVMASTVFERTIRLSHFWSSEETPQSPTRASIRTEMQSIARTTTNFARRITPVEQLSTDEQDHRTLLVAHGLAHAAMMTMHSVRASDTPAGDMSAINSALTHASEIAKILDKISRDDSAPFDPIISIIGYLAAEVFFKEEHRLLSISESQALSSSSARRLTSAQTNITGISDSLQRCATASDGGIFGEQADKMIGLTAER